MSFTLCITRMPIKGGCPIGGQALIVVWSLHQINVRSWTFWSKKLSTKGCGGCFPNGWDLGDPSPSFLLWQSPLLFSSVWTVSTGGLSLHHEEETGTPKAIWPPTSVFHDLEKVTLLRIDWVQNGRTSRASRGRNFKRILITSDHVNLLLLFWRNYLYLKKKYNRPIRSLTCHMEVTTGWYPQN